jgi:hypothetical protein
MRFGKLVVVEPAFEHLKHGRHMQWICQCDCGATGIVVRGTVLTRGEKLSCGCGSGYKRDRKNIYKEITGIDVPRDMSVIFLDGDCHNHDASNMYLVSHAVYNKMVINKWLDLEPAAKILALKVCELDRLCYVLEKNRS